MNHGVHVKASFFAILSDVLSKALNVIGVAHEMIEAFKLPELASSSQKMVDLPNCKVLPGITLASQPRTGQKADHDVYVVGHYDKIGNVILDSCGGVALRHRSRVKTVGSRSAPTTTSP